MLIGSALLINLQGRSSDPPLNDMVEEQKFDAL